MLQNVTDPGAERYLQREDEAIGGPAVKWRGRPGEVRVTRERRWRSSDAQSKQRHIIPLAVITQGVFAVDAAISLHPSHLEFSNVKI